MATTGASIQPLKPAATTCDATIATGGLSSQTPVPASAGQGGDFQGFGILQPTGPPVQDDVPGLYRDGRVRNPVPSKLKGKTDARNGNFGVMHIDLTTTNETKERDAAAKRTSEGTQLAAKLAQTDRYVPIKRSKFIHRTNNQPVPRSPQAPPPHRRASPLTAAETKTEQARLLTLLRSLHPVLVVDQLCKALAFFGGIPGAEPSTEGSFPESAEFNGSGSLFVGWLGEIFPALGQGSGLIVQPAAAKRPRGRPRGSKNTKGKKEKSLRKRLALAGRPAQASENPRVADGLVDEGHVDDSWVDVDENNGTCDEEDIPDVSQNTTMLYTATPPDNSRSTARSTALMSEARSSTPDTSSLVIPTPKRRGRPKGSKNRPKDGASLLSTAQKPADAASTSTAAGAAEATPVTKKRKPGPGRPKGSKNRPKELQPPALVTEVELQPVSAALQTEREESGTSRPAESTHPSYSALNATPGRPAELQQSLPQNSAPATPSQDAHQVDFITVKANVRGASKETKRKRKAPAAETTAIKNAQVSTTATERGPAPGAEDAVAGFSSGSHPPNQASAGTVSSMSSDSTTKQQAKRRKVVKGSPEQPAVDVQVDQSTDENQAVPGPAVSQPPRQRPMSTEDYSAMTVNTDKNDGVPRARSINQSSQQHNVNSQHAVSDPQPDFGQNHGVSGGNIDQLQASKPVTAPSYPMNISGRSSQGMYNHARSVQGLLEQQTQRQHKNKQQQPPPPPPSRQNHYLQQPQAQQLQQRQQQQQQHQRQQPESRQQTHSENHAHASQHHVMNSGSVSVSSTAGHNENSFDGSAGDRRYRGLMPQQPSFGTQVPLSVSPDNNYRNSASRSVQNQTSAFQRPVHPTSSSGMPYQDYSDPAFLEMTGLDSTSHASLAMSQASYGIPGDAMQRPHSTMNPSYTSTSSMGPSFNGSMTDRIYHSLRRQ